MVSRPLRELPPAFLCAIAYYSFSLSGGASSTRAASFFDAAFFFAAAFFLATRQDIVDPQDRQVLTVPVAAAIILPALLLENDDLAVPHLLEDRCRYGGAIHHGAPTVWLLSSPTIKTSLRLTVAPSSASSFSTRITSSLATLYCLPPLLITANIRTFFLVSSCPAIIEAKIERIPTAGPIGPAKRAATILTAETKSTVLKGFLLPSLCRGPLL